MTRIKLLDAKGNAVLGAYTFPGETIQGSCKGNRITFETPGGSYILADPGILPNDGIKIDTSEDEPYHEGMGTCLPMVKVTATTQPEGVSRTALTSCTPKSPLGACFAFGVRSDPEVLGGIGWSWRSRPCFERPGIVCRPCCQRLMTRIQWKTWNEPGIRWVSRPDLSD